MKKVKKHLREKKADEVIAHVFHPNALKHIKEHVEKLPIKKRKPSKQ